MVLAPRMKQIQSYRKLSTNQIHRGDCLELLAQLPDGGIHLAFADPPVGGDYLEWSKRWMAEVVRVLRPRPALVSNPARPSRL